MEALFLVEQEEAAGLNAGCRTDRECAGSPNLKTRRGPGCTAGLGRRITPASAVPMATTTPHKAVRPRKSRRFGESGISPLLSEQEPLHRDGMRRAALRAQGARGCTGLRLSESPSRRNHRPRGQQRVDLRRRRQLLQSHQFQAQRGADIHTPAAQNAFLAIEDGVDATIQAAARLRRQLAPRYIRSPPSASDRQAAPWQALPGYALVSGLRNRPRAGSLRSRRVAAFHAGGSLAGEEPVHTPRRLLAAGDGVDHETCAVAPRSPAAKTPGVPVAHVSGSTWSLETSPRKAQIGHLAHRKTRCLLPHRRSRNRHTPARSGGWRRIPTARARKRTPATTFWPFLRGRGILWDRADCREHAFFLALDDLDFVGRHLFARFEARKMDLAHASWRSATREISVSVCRATRRSGSYGIRTAERETSKATFPPPITTTRRPMGSALRATWRAENRCRHRCLARPTQVVAAYGPAYAPTAMMTA